MVLLLVEGLLQLHTIYYVQFAVRLLTPSTVLKTSRGHALLHVISYSSV